MVFLDGWSGTAGDLQHRYGLSTESVLRTTSRRDKPWKRITYIIFNGGCCCFFFLLVWETDMHTLHSIAMAWNYTQIQCSAHFSLTFNSWLNIIIKQWYNFINILDSVMKIYAEWKDVFVHHTKIWHTSNIVIIYDYLIYDIQVSYEVISPAAKWNTVFSLISAPGRPTISMRGY